MQLGSDGDLTIVDLDHAWTIDEEKLHSKNNATPLNGVELTGWAGGRSRGRVVMQDGELVDEPSGRPVILVRTPTRWRRDELLSLVPLGLETGLDRARCGARQPGRLRVRPLSARDRASGPTRPRRPRATPACRVDAGPDPRPRRGRGRALLPAARLQPLRRAVAVDGCTVKAALGSASATGRKLLMKNLTSSATTPWSARGTTFTRTSTWCRRREPRTDAASSGCRPPAQRGIKVGVNDRGVAAGSNIAHIRAGGPKDRRAAGACERPHPAAARGPRGGDACRRGSAILAKTMEAPTSTPGNMEFADAAVVWVLETSYDRFACDVTGRPPSCGRTADARAPERPRRRPERRALSPLQRAARGGRGERRRQLRRPRRRLGRPRERARRELDLPPRGRLPRGDASLGAGVVEIDPAQPDSRIALALGKPCRAWRNPESHIELTADAEPGDIPAAFLDGSAWRSPTARSPTRRRSSAEARPITPRAPARRAMTEVGRPIPMREARQRVTGALPFAVNVRVPGMLHGKIVRSTCAHGVIRRLDVSAAAQSAGVRGARRRRPGRRGHRVPLRPRDPDRPLLAIDRVRFSGEPVAAVIAVDEDAAAAACELVTSSTATCPCSRLPRRRWRPGRPTSTTRSRCASGRRFPTSCSTLERARTSATTSGCATATSRRGSRMPTRSSRTCSGPRPSNTATSSLTSPSWRSSPARRRCGRPGEPVHRPLPGRRDAAAARERGARRRLERRRRLRVEDLPAARAARRRHVMACGREVGPRRADPHRGVLHHHPPCGDGQLDRGAPRRHDRRARGADPLGAAGAYADIGPRLIKNGGYSSAGPYRIPHVAVDSYAVYTNVTPAGGFRGYAILQAAWAYESQMDMIAERSASIRSSYGSRTCCATATSSPPARPSRTSTSASCCTRSPSDRLERRGPRRRPRPAWCAARASPARSRPR